MKKLLIVVACSAALCGTLFAADGAAIYKRCIACHGAKAEKSYLNKVPVLAKVAPADRLADMEAYKAGTIGGGKGKFGMGSIMKMQMKSLSKEDMQAVNDYITKLSGSK